MKRELIVVDVLLDDLFRIEAIYRHQLQTLILELGVYLLQVRKLLTACASSIEPEVHQYGLLPSRGVVQRNVIALQRDEVELFGQLTDRNKL